jgi:hypothetical protein
MTGSQSRLAAPHGDAFVPVRDAAPARWRAPKTFGFLSAFPRIALSDTEYLMTAHHLPVALEIEGDHARVVAVLDGDLLSRPILDARFRWKAGYVPIRLRCLPFGLAPAVGDVADAERLVLHPALGLTGDQGEAIFASAGKLSSPAAAILDALLRLEQGQRRLAEAAETLLLAGILVPLAERGPRHGHPALYSVDAARLDALTPLQCAAAVRSSFLPFELAAAMAFSRRHLRGDVQPEQSVAGEGGLLSADLDQLIRGVERYPLILDTSELIRVEEL